MPSDIETDSKLIGRANFLGHLFQFDDDLTWRPLDDDPSGIAHFLNRVKPVVLRGYGPSKGECAHWLFLQVVELFRGEETEFIPPEDDDEEIVY